MAEEKDVRSLRVAVEIAAVMCRYQENASERIVEIVDAALRSAAQEAQARLLVELTSRSLIRSDQQANEAFDDLCARILKEGPL